jgi:glycosyltransferase involved in cell wall biosynthesis
MLAKRGVYPELHLTLYGEWTGLYQQIEKARSVGARITNHGFTDSQLLYQACGYQIYPSVAESFGLGLVEAAEAGCAILASDRPFVRQVVNPLVTFDPNSATAIEEAVLRTYEKCASASEVVVSNQLPRLIEWIRNGSWAGPA